MYLCTKFYAFVQICTFIPLTNDLDYGIRNWILKFADHTKIFSGDNGSEVCVRLQKDLDTLVNWSKE